MPTAPKNAFEFRLRQLVFPGIRMAKDDPADAEALVDMGVGGFCVYGGTPASLFALTSRLQARARVPLLFAGDYEDGLASQAPGGTRMPSNMALAAAGRPELAELKARVTAAEARAVGVPWVFAPVVDLADRPDNPIVNIRAFSDAAPLSSRFAAAYCRGLREAGALSCVKHFPGHGDVGQDSHLTLPRLATSLARLKSRELKPYGAASAADSAMLAHLSVPALDRRRPATLSAAAYALLRKVMDPSVCAVTDALDMKAVADRYGELDAALTALAAGADVILVPKNPALLLKGFTAKAFARGLERRVEEAYLRVAALKARAGLFSAAPASRRGLGVIQNAAHLRAADKMAEAALAPVGPWRKTLPRSGVRLIHAGDAAPVFAAELRRQGVRIWQGGLPTAVVALHPRAYTGRIALGPAAREISAAVRGGLVVSLGSPFVLSELRGWKAGLCAFSNCEASQRSAARALAGRAPATARMPVALSSK